MGITNDNSNQLTYFTGTVYNPESDLVVRYGIQRSISTNKFFPTYVFNGGEDLGTSYSIYSSNPFYSIFLVSEGGASYSSLNDAEFNAIQKASLDVNSPYALSLFAFSGLALLRLRKNK